MGHRSGVRDTVRSGRRIDLGRRPQRVGERDRLRECPYLGVSRNRAGGGRPRPTRRSRRDPPRRTPARRRVPGRSRGDRRSRVKANVRDRAVAIQLDFARLVLNFRSSRGVQTARASRAQDSGAPESRKDRREFPGLDGRTTHRLPGPSAVSSECSVTDDRRRRSLLAYPRENEQLRALRTISFRAGCAIRRGVTTRSERRKRSTRSHRAATVARSAIGRAVTLPNR
jgi:hypothetical protein